MKDKIKIIIGVCVIAIVVVTIYFIKNHSIQAKLSAIPPAEPTIVSFAKAEQVNWPDQVLAIGSISALKGVNLRAEAAGRITKIFVESGNAVKQGTPLFQIYPNVLEAQLKQAQAALRLSEFEYSRYQQLYKTGAVSLEQVTRTKSQLDVNKAEVETISQQLTLTTIVAPFDGILGLRQVEIGDYVQPGQIIATFQNTDEVRVDFNIPEQYANQVKPGYTVQVTSPALPNQTFTGSVYAINPLINEPTRMLDIRARVKSTQLLPGSYVNVALILNHQRPYIVIPQTAVLKSLHGDSVFKVVNGKAKQVVVQLGDRRGDMVAILDGLQAGDTVVSAGQMKINDGASVTDQGALRATPAQPQPLSPS